MQSNHDRPNLAKTSHVPNSPNVRTRGVAEERRFGGSDYHGNSVLEVT